MTIQQALADPLGYVKQLESDGVLVSEPPSVELFKSMPSLPMFHRLEFVGTDKCIDVQISGGMNVGLRVDEWSRAVLLLYGVFH